MNDKPKLRAGKIVKDSFELYKKNFGLFFRISLAGFFMISLAQILDINHLKKSPTLPPGLVLLTFAGALLSVWAVASLITAFSKKRQGEQINFTKAFSDSLNKYPRLLVLNLIIGGLIFISTAILAIIPIVGILLAVILAIFLAIIFLIVPAAAVLDKDRFFSPVGLSPSLILKNFWKTLALLAILILPYFILMVIITAIFGDRTIAASIISAIAGLLFSPFYIGNLVLLYNELKEKKEAQIPQMGGAL